jgi:serine/threonine protein kinase
MSVVFQHIGHFEVQREIGRGGMATVFLAMDQRANRPVALKLVPVGNDREAQEILEAEHWGARLQEQFSRSSRYVPAVYEHGIEGSYFYIAMEYLGGRNLSEVMSNGPLIPPRAVAIAVQLCEFLESAHTFQTTLDGRDLRSLLHGDLKPRNIRVLDGDEIKVLDFGIAKALSLSRKVTRNDFGSIAYLSPERLESGEIDEHADLWAVGVLLYEMIGGVQPYTAPDTRRLEQRIRSRVAPPSLHARCPVGLQAIIARLLAPSPAERYQDARAVRDDLLAFSSGITTQAEREGWPARHSDEPPTRRTTPAPPADEEATRRTIKPPPTVPLPQSPVRRGARAAAAIAAAVTSAARGSRTSSGSQARSGEPAAGSAAAPLPDAKVKKPGRRRRFLRRAAVIAAIVIGFNEMRIGTRADQLAGMVPHKELDTIVDAWNQYDELADRSFNMRLSGLEQALLRQTQLLADRVAENYKSSTPTVREAQWQQARAALARAVSLRPDNARLRGSLRYADGHIYRINGEARKERRQLAEAQEALTNAVTSFREAAEFRPNWPDPFLGLMRTFVYGLEDVERGADALREAERLGYKPGNREYQMLAESYRVRADSLARMGRSQSDRDREEEYLKRAAESYERSIEHYKRIVGVEDADRAMRLTQRALERVQRRLDELSGPRALTLEGLLRWP